MTWQVHWSAAKWTFFQKMLCNSFYWMNRIPLTSQSAIDNKSASFRVMAIGIDHDRVCAGVVGTAIRNSTSCAGRRAAACGRAGRHNECCSGLQYQPRQHRPYKWSISILPRSQFTKSKRNLRFRRLVPLFVPIGVCVTTHDDGTASDVTIGMWRHNQQVTNHERNGKPWFSLPK